MENRFGIKDGVIIVLLIVSIIMVALAMLQFDRQWNDVKTLGTKQNDMIKAQAAQDRTAKEQSSRLSDLKKDQEDQLKTLQEEVSALKELVSNLKNIKVVQVDPDTLNNPPATQPVAQDNTTVPNKVAADAKWEGGDRDFFNRIKAAQQKTDYKIGDIYVNSFSGKVGIITPYLSSDSYGSTIQGYVLQSLADRDSETLEWEPVLAKEWHTSEDGLIHTFRMRNDAVFSDGNPVTVDDVVFTFDLIMNPKFESPHSRSYFERIKKVIKVDDETVQFVYDEPYFRAFELAAGMNILSKNYYGQFTAEQINDNPGMLMGSGPYRMNTPDGWKPGQPVTLYRNERYWGPPAPFDEIRTKIILNTNARLVEFKNTDIDSFGASPKQWVKMIKNDKVNEISNNYKYLSGSAGYAYIGWNQQKVDGNPSRFADPRVRLAMTYLVPRQQIVDKVLLGLARVSKGPFHPNSKQNSPNVTPHDYSPDKAKELLTQAGYVYSERRRALIGPDGKPFSFKLMYPSGSPVYEEMMSMVQNSFAKVGINMEKDPIEWSVFLKKMDARDFDAISLRWTGGIETDINQMFHSDQMKAKGHNFIHYKNEKLDEYIEQARKTVNEKKRMEIWKKCHEILHQDQPYTFLFVSDSLLFINKRLQNVEKLEMGLNPNTEWFVK